MHYAPFTLSKFNLYLLNIFFEKVLTIRTKRGIIYTHKGKASGTPTLIIYKNKKTKKEREIIIMAQVKMAREDEVFCNYNVVLEYYEGNICVKTDDSIDVGDGNYEVVNNDVKTTAKSAARATLLDLLATYEDVAGYYDSYLDGDDYYDIKWIVYVTVYDSYDDYVNDTFHERKPITSFSMLESEYVEEYLK